MGAAYRRSPNLPDQCHGHQGNRTTCASQRQCTQPACHGVDNLAHPVLRHGLWPFFTEADTFFPRNDGNDRLPLSGLCKCVWPCNFLDNGRESRCRWLSCLLLDSAACYRRWNRWIDRADLCGNRVFERFQARSDERRSRLRNRTKRCFRASSLVEARQVRSTLTTVSFGSTVAGRDRRRLFRLGNLLC